MASQSNKSTQTDEYYSLCDAIKIVVKSTADVERINENTGLALMHIACINKNVDAVKMLMVYNPNINLPTVETNKQANLENRVPVGSTPLSIAVNNSDVAITKLLLEKYHNLNNINCVGLLNIAIYKGCKEIIEILLDFGADINAADHDGITPLHSSTMSYDMYKNRYPFSTMTNHTYKYVPLELVEFLLKRGANVHCVDKIKMTPLHYACKTKRFDIILLLLTYNINVNARNKYHQTPLHVLFDENFKLADANEFEQLKQLCDRFVELKVDINAVDSEGRTLLFYVCMFGYDDMVGILLKHNANIHIPNRYGKTPLYVAAETYGDITKIVQILIEHNVDVNFVDENKNTILHIAGKAFNLEVPHIFDKLHVNINAKNKEGKTALDIATKSGAVAMVEVLIKKGADINIPSTNNSTLLHDAVLGIASFCEQFSKYKEVDYENNECVKKMLLYSNAMIKYIQTFQILQLHVVKLCTARLYVKQEMVHFIYNGMARNVHNLKNIKIDFSQFEQQCKDEIEKLKEENIFNITFYNLLTNDIHIMAKNSKHKNMRQIIFSNDYEQRFPLYMNVIKNRLQASEIRSKLLRMIERENISSIFNHLPYICVNEILRVLSNEDLKAVLSVLNPEFIP